MSELAAISKHENPPKIIWRSLLGDCPRPEVIFRDEQKFYVQLFGFAASDDQKKELLMNCRKDMLSAVHNFAKTAVCKGGYWVPGIFVVDLAKLALFVNQK